MSTDHSPNLSCTSADEVGLPDDFFDPTAIAYYDPARPVRRQYADKMTEVPS